MGVTPVVSSQLREETTKWLKRTYSCLFQTSLVSDEVFRRLFRDSRVLVGYARVIFLVVALYYMTSNYIAASFLYVLSGFLDAFDGWAARKFNQG